MAPRSTAGQPHDGPPTPTCHHQDLRHHCHPRRARRANDAGKAIKVRVSFTDDAGNDEELIQRRNGRSGGGGSRQTAADGHGPRRAVVPQRAERVHIRAAVQRGPQAGLQLHESGAGSCVHRDRGIGDLCAPAGAARQHPMVGHPVTPGSSADVTIGPERHHGLRGRRRHLHRGRQEAVRHAPTTELTVNGPGQ